MLLSTDEDTKNRCLNCTDGIQKIVLADRVQDKSQPDIGHTSSKFCEDLLMVPPINIPTYVGCLYSFKTNFPFPPHIQVQEVHGKQLRPQVSGQFCHKNVLLCKGY